MFISIKSARTVPVLAVLLVAYTDRPTEPVPVAVHSSVSANQSTPDLVRQLAAARGITPLPNRVPVRASLVRLGQALAFDKVRSGNRDISCMT